MGKKGSNTGPRSKSKDVVDSKMKYILFLVLFTFPALAALLGSTGSLLGNLSTFLTDFRMILMVLLAATIMTFTFVYSKKARSFARYVVPVFFAILLWPTCQVYICSPIEVENAVIGTDFSLKATSKEFMEKTVIGCFNKTKLPASVYGISLYTPKLRLTVKHSEIVDLNLTTNARVGGEEVKTHKLVLIRSLRSVRKRIHSLYMMARAPLKLKKFNEGLKEKKNFVLNGKLNELTAGMKNIKGELEKKGLYIRPFLFEIRQVELRERPKEPEKKQETKEKESKENPQDDKKDETKTEKEKPKAKEQSRPDEVKEDVGVEEEAEDDREPEYVIEDEDEDATIEEESW